MAILEYPFAIGLFILSYMGVYSKTASIVIVSSVIFSVGVSLPGINVMPSGERFLLFLLGGLWGTLGAAIIPIILTIKKSSSTSITEAASTPTTARSYLLLNILLPSSFIQLVNCYTH